MDTLTLAVHVAQLALRRDLDDCTVYQCANVVGQWRWYGAESSHTGEEMFFVEAAPLIPPISMVPLY